MLILQRVLFAIKIHVNMEALANMTEITNATARIGFMEKPVKVSVIAVMYNYKIYLHNTLYSGNVTLYSVIPLLCVYINMCHLP